MQNPIWENDVNMPRFPQLQENIKTDVLVIGGGLCGILTAYFLQWSGVECCLVEANRIGSGVTGRTTAKITALQGLTYHSMKEKLGRERAKLYFEACTSALERYRCMAKNMDCDFIYTPAYTYSKTDRRKLEEEVRTIRCLGGTAEFIEQPGLPFETVGAVKMPMQGQFHPLKFLSEISKNLKIYENTRVIKISGNCAVTETGTITAKKIVVATHFPFLNFYGGYFLKLYQSRSYVIGLEDVPVLDGMYRDENANGLSFRSQGKTLLLGGTEHRTGKPSKGWKPLRDFAAEYYPEAKERYAWATQDCMSLDGLPYIGQYSWRKADLYVATGFNKWGMTASMTAALLLRDMIMERENEFASLFSPQRSILHRQLLCNTREAIQGLLTPTAKRCPHLGCALKWNKQEHSWDCSCHGSRFLENGTLLNNPANGDIK